MELHDLSPDTIDRLFQLFTSECARDNSLPTPKDFQIWLVENGYIDD